MKPSSFQRIRFVTGLVAVASAAACGLAIVGQIEDPTPDAGTGPVDVPADGSNATADVRVIPTVDAGDASDGSTEAALEPALDAALADAQALDGTFTRDATLSPDDGSSRDAGPDGSCLAGSVYCPGTGKCVTSCLGCDAGSLACPVSNECVPDCASCKGNRFECWACGIDTTTLVKASCTEEPGPACYTIGLRHCAGCDNAGCFGSDQVCVVLSGTLGITECRGCGEANTEKAKCAGGGKCAAPDLKCSK